MNRKLATVALLALASCFALPADAFAGPTGTIKITRDAVGTDAYSGPSSGGFKVIGFTGLNIPTPGNNVRTPNSVHGLGFFHTFCIELNEDILLGRNYDWELNSAAVGGGVSGGNPDPISSETAYLFSKFWAGTLSNYEYVDLGDQAGERGVSSEQLQQAIWYLEGEVSSLTGNAQASTWVTEAQNAVANGSFSGIGNVRVLNITETLSDGTIKQRQDLLVVVPLPPAALAGFFVLGGLGLIRRRRKKLLAGA